MNARELTIGLYQSIAAADRRRVFEHWHASSIAKCPRAQYFERKGVLPVVEPSSALKLRWRVGHLVEEAIRKHVQTVLPTTISNVRFTLNDLDLTGEIDNYDLKTKTLMSIKSVHPQAVKYKPVGDDRFHLKDSRPYLAHEFQEHAYIPLLESVGLEVNEIVYVYISLSGIIVAYVTKPDETIALAVQGRLRELNQAWASQIPPDCICTPEQPLWGSQMQFCDYKGDTCCNLNLLKEVA